jgi:hypothetical protein
MSSDIRSMRKRAWRWLAFGLTGTIAIGLAGCSGNPVDSMNFYPVKGKVTLPDGKPFASARVVFQGTKSSLTSTATTESDGTFVVKGTKDGLPEGDYKVRIEVGDTGPAKKKTRLPFAAKYLDEDASGLTAKVKPEGLNDFEFKLTSK